MINMSKHITHVRSSTLALNINFERTETNRLISYLLNVKSASEMLTSIQLDLHTLSTHEFQVQILRGAMTS